MHEELWVGVELKLQYAEFHLRQMERSLQPPERTATNVALEASGAILDTGWQRSFYACLDAFLVAARSVPEVIQCCFGADRGHPVVRDWFDSLPSAERNRRNAFRDQFKGTHDAFRVLPLSKARDISVHRTGYAPVKVAITGVFGVTYVGGPTEQVPMSETRLAFLAKPMPLRALWDDFEIDGRPLFPTCHDYLKSARGLIDEARSISNRVHGTNRLTSPPP